MFYFILSLVRDRHRAEDLAQEVFLVAYRRRHDFRPGGPVAGWLWGIARHVVMADWRRTQRRPSPLDQETLEALADAFVQAQTTHTHHADWLVGIDDCLARLDQKNRAVLASRYRDDKSIEEMSADMGVGISALKMRLLRLRQRLAECLSRKRAEAKR